MGTSSGGRGRVAVVSAVTAMVVLVAVAAFVGYRQTFHTVADPATWVPAATGGPSGPTSLPSDSPSPSQSPTPSPTPSLGASPTKAPAKKAAVKPVPSHAKVPAPPPAPPPPPPTCTKTYVGTAASQAQVGAALDAAAATGYQPYIKDVPQRQIQVDPVLLKAVAWQESGWQSNVKSCYGAFGATQMTSGTASWMNGNYGSSYDMQTLAGNASLGAEYLAWLIYYFGHFCYADDYDIADTNPNAPDLRDAVLAAYNLGIGAVDTAAGVVIPNRAYTNDVEGLMDSQPWKS
jgi:hypothetical protein